MLELSIVFILLLTFIIMLVMLVKNLFPTPDYDLSTEYDQNIDFTTTPFEF